MLFSLCPAIILGQVEIDFENGLSTGWEQFPSGRWDVSSEDPLSGNYSLRHIYDNSESGCDAISYHFGELLTDSLIRWKFLLHYDYKPSGSNHWTVFLMSEQGAANLMDSKNALCIGVNRESTDDSLRIYRIMDGRLSDIVTLPVNWEKDVEQDSVAFTILKNRYGGFEFLLENLNKGTETRFETDDLNSVPENAEYFGIEYCYTSTKDRLLSMDNLSVFASFHRDTLPPVILTLKIINRNTLEWEFDEEVYVQENSRVFADPGIEADSVGTSGNHLTAFFPDSFENEHQYSYRLENISDRKGNSADYEDEFKFFYPGYKDVVITEIFADPEPSVYLPPEEYIEIYNRSEHVISLEKWILNCGSRKFTLPRYFIGPGEFRVLRSNVNSRLGYIENSIPVFSSPAILANPGMLLSLLSPEGEVIDALEYSEKWYRDDIRAGGGWSLERIDTDNLCGGAENWTVSVDPDGGTPGEPNSVSGIIVDSELPFVQRVIYKDGESWILQMSETVREVEDYRFDVEDKVFTDLELLPPLYDRFYMEIYPGKQLPCVFRLPVFVEDCNGNRIAPVDSMVLDIPLKPGLTDVIITEVMYNGNDFIPEFIEIYNRSDQIIGLDNLCLEIRDDPVTPAVLNCISGDMILLYPGEFLAINPDSWSMELQYSITSKSSLYEMDTWRSLPDAGARICLRDRSGLLIDEMDYSDRMQFPLLISPDGVSLERISLDSETGVNSGWHSASSVSGYATPGYMNSQKVTLSNIKKNFYAETEKFTPDNDGMDDVAIFRFSFEKEGYTGTIMIFDPAGRLIRKLYSNILMGVDGYLSWDGRDDTGNVCHTGIYLVYMEVFHLSGNRKSFRDTIVLIRR